MPFETLDSSGEAVITLRVIGATKFELVDGFRYLDQYDDYAPYEVPGSSTTDLASVPFFLQWLVRSYGKHTKAALVHDQLWDGNKSLAELQKANTVFRHAMWETDVPFIRRWFMWTAVSLGMLSKKTRGQVQLGVWITALVVSVSAVLASFDVSLSPGVPLWTLGLAVVAAAVVSLALLGRSPTIAAIAKRVLMGLAGVVAVTSVATVVGRSDWVSDHAALVALVALAVALGAWLDLVLAGVIGTTTLVLLVVPLLGVFFGLFVYGLFEVASLGVLWVGRRLKSRSGRTVVGTLNPVASEALRARSPDGLDVSLRASQL